MRKEDVRSYNSHHAPWRIEKGSNSEGFTTQAHNTETGEIAGSWQGWNQASRSAAMHAIMEIKLSPARSSLRKDSPMIHVFTFESTREAYDRSQCDDSIHDGDVLLVPSESAIGIMVSAWPTALDATTAGEQFHKLADGVTWDAVPSHRGVSFDYSASAKIARDIAAEPPAGTCRTCGRACGDVDTMPRACCGTMSEPDAADHRHDRLRALTELESLSALVSDIREIESGEYGADAADVYSRKLAELRTMLDTLAPDVLADVTDAALELAGEEYGALAAVSRMYDRSDDAPYSTGDIGAITPADAMTILEWCRDFAADCEWTEDAEYVADLPPSVMIRSAAMHYEGGIAALVRDALALSRAYSAANDRCEREHAERGVVTLRERERYSVAAKLAADALPELLQRAESRARDANPVETWRTIAEDAADVLADADAITSGKLVDKLPPLALRALGKVLATRSIDVARHELVQARVMLADVCELANGTACRGEEWSEVGSRLHYAAMPLRAIVREARAAMRDNEASYFNGETFSTNEPRGE